MLVTLSFTYYLGNMSGRKDAEANGYAAQYPHETTQRVKTCFTKTDPEAVQECVQEAVRAGHEGKNSDRDLQAQEEMSVWAFWALVMTTAQLCVSALGFVGLGFTIRQGQKDYVAGNPPKFLLSRLRIDLSKGLEPLSRIGRAYLINTGHNAAIITRSDIRFFYCGPSEVPLDPHYDEGGIKIGQRIEPGERYQWNVQGYGFGHIKHDIAAIADGSSTKDGAAVKKLYAVGIVDSVDPIGNEHHFVFCREYDPKTRRFVHSKDTEHEYQS